jgi:hypothetical protein
MIFSVAANLAADGYIPLGYLPFDKAESLAG